MFSRSEVFVYLCVFAENDLKAGTLDLIYYFFALVLYLHIAFMKLECIFGFFPLFEVRHNVNHIEFVQCQ